MCQQSASEGRIMLWVEDCARARAVEREGERDGRDGLPEAAAQRRAEESHYPREYLCGYHRGRAEAEKATE